MMEHVRSFEARNAHRSPPYCRRRAVSPIASVLGLLSLTQACGALAVDADRGRQLYENQCQACHSNLLHSKDARKINTLTELQRRVAAWGIHAGGDWGSEEVNDVTLYLDRSFYHFDVAQP